MAVATAEDVSALLDRITKLEGALRPFADCLDGVEECFAVALHPSEDVILIGSGMEADRLDIEDFRAAHAAYYPDSA